MNVTIRPMDLTKQHPRSPNEKLAGIVSLPRLIDKAHANAEGTLGEYDIDCPHDKPLLAFLGIDFKTFAAKVKEYRYDDAHIAQWVTGLLAGKTPRDLQDFNDKRRAWGPDAHSRAYFETLRRKLAPHRTDLHTWFALLDIDEGRTG
jgi:Domain of unknown function (DUF5069)